MKKVLIIALSLFVFSAFVNAESWHTANAVNIAWGAVDKIAETDIVKYQVYVKSINDGEITMYGDETSEIDVYVKFEKEGKYYIGVQAIRYPINEIIGIKSETISWSDNPEVCGETGTFGITFYKSPSNVLGIRITK